MEQKADEVDSPIIKEYKGSGDGEHQVILRRKLRASFVLISTVRINSR